MDLMLVGGGLAAGGYILNSSNKSNNKNSANTPDVYNSAVLDSRMLERQQMDLHLKKTNSIDTYMKRPESVRNGEQRDTKLENHTSMSLTGEMRPNDQFTHNNMVPFYGSKVRQNVDANATSGIVERFTGVSVTDKPKTEIEPLFSPTKDNIHGTRVASEDIYDRYEASRYKQGVPLTEPVRVGPGLNKGYTANPTGGFHDIDNLQYARDPTVDEMRVKNNPKVSYEGRLIRGFKGTRRGMTPVVSKNRVIRFHSYDNDLRVNATPVVQAPRKRENFVLNPTTRQNTSHSYVPPAGPTTVSQQQSQIASKNAKTNRQELDGYGFRNAHNPQNTESKLKIQYCSEVNKIGAEETGYLGGARGVVQKMIAPLQDIMRPTIKETNIHDSGIGFAATTGQKHLYNPTDIARPTIKETNIHDSRLGQVRPIQLKSNPENPLPTKKTARETLENYIASANLTGPNKSILKSNDVTKTTVKETICEDNRKGIATFSKGGGYKTNPVVAPATYKQFTAETEYSGQAHGRQYGGYSVMNANAPETSRQDLSTVPYSGIANGEDKPKSYADVYNATMNEIKEEISKGRTPTQTGIKVGGHVNEIGVVDACDGLENRQIFSGATPIRNTPIDSSAIHIRNEKCQNDISTRLDERSVEAFKKNPYTQSLDSVA
jgi:hypothetical protein